MQFILKAVLGTCLFGLILWCAQSGNARAAGMMLTFPALNRTAEVWFLVSGEGKAEAVQKALVPEGTVEETPARGITVQHTTWFLDSAAASLLDH